MNIDEIAGIARLMKESGLTEFSIASEEMTLTLKRGPHVVAAAHTTTAAAAPEPAPTSTAPAAPDPEPAAAPETGMLITAPIVGTFYAASTPDAEPLVRVGDRVEEDSVVCIIEAMKVMNEIKAEKSGIIRCILVENTAPVEYGQELFELDPA